MSYYLGIDLGGSSIKAVATTPDGTPVAMENVPFQDRDMAWAREIRTIVLRFREHRGEPLGIGLAAPGLAAADGRSIASMPGRLLGLEGLVWSEYLDFRKPVPVSNDAHAALLGEAWQGAARGRQHVFMLTLGTGVGGAAMVDGRLLKGRLGRAGHLGHISLDFNGALDDLNTPGSLEQELGNKSIQRRSQGRYATTLELVTAHRAGEAEATRLWMQSIRALAAGIASLINVLDPEVVILGGGIASAGEALFDPLRGELDRFEWRPGGATVEIVPAQLGDRAGGFGAAWTAIRGSS